MLSMTVSTAVDSIEDLRRRVRVFKILIEVKEKLNDARSQFMVLFLSLDPTE
jgi:hypothetical protein